MNLAPQSRAVERLALVLCVLVSLILLGLPAANKIDVAQVLADVLTSPWTRTIAFVSDLSDVRAENAELAARLAAVTMDLESAERLCRERDALREALGLHRREPSRVIPCEVVVLRVDDATTLVRVRSAHDVAWRVHQPVITSGGLVGRVLRADGTKAAWVELASSTDFAICCEVERTGLPGILRPGLGTFSLTLVGRDEDVRPGDRLVTSDIPAVGAGDEAIAPAMPRGLPVGIVTAVDTPLREIFKSVQVELLADLGALDLVFVVVGDGDWWDAPASGTDIPSTEQTP